MEMVALPAERIHSDGNTHKGQGVSGPRATEESKQRWFQIAEVSGERQRGADVGKSR